MDNLTHSLIGAALGQAGLKRKTGLAMPALIIGANLPDIDAGCTIYGLESLAMRRGITHGPIALVLLPLLLTLILVGFDRWQAKRGKRPEGRAPVRPGWLFALSFVACLTHPAMDWLNNYGIRLLEPFSHQWFYGDTLFIIDVWLWAILIGGLFWSWRAERDAGNWAERGRRVLMIAGGYILFNWLITMQAETQGYHQLARRWDIRPADNSQLLVVANTGPVLFWKREMLWSDGPFHGRGLYSLFEGVSWEGEGRNVFPDADISTATKRDPVVRAFLFWARMPVVEREADGSIVLRDQRFSQPAVRDRFQVRLGQEKPSPK